MKMETFNRSARISLADSLLDALRKRNDTVTQGDASMNLNYLYLVCGNGATIDDVCSVLDELVLDNRIEVTHKSTIWATCYIIKKD